MSAADAGLHPQFVSPLRWFVHLQDALSAAKRDARTVMLVHGPRVCMGTRGLVERTLAKEELVEMVSQRFVCVASEAIEVEPEVEKILGSLPNRASTPLCVYLSADGRVLHSTAGGRPPAVLLNDMLQALSKR